MKVEFLAKFSRDLDKISDLRLKEKVLKIILECEDALTFNEIKNIKKLRGDKISYRIRIGDYRLGLYFEFGIIQFARIVHRKDIYKVFP
jgi:mRNA interferase RelE/StbE